MPNALVAQVCFIFFLSGVSALIFETLWFRQAGLTFGNGVWASALVVSSYMAGLALGNGLAARYGHRVRRPIRFYALLELVIALAGLSLVVLLPRSTPLLALLFRPLLDHPWLLQPARFAAAFAVLAAPAIAMGATLPVLVKALLHEQRDFGRLLGLLYGINTLGAVAGAVSSELAWVPIAGVIGAGCVAAGFNLLAAGLALVVSRHARAADSPIVALPQERSAIGFTAMRLLAASFLAGGILLALEVVWFRTVVLIAPSTSEAFALMLAVVLAGIGLGGLVAAVWLRVQPGAHAYVSVVALLSGAGTVFAYLAYPATIVRLVGIRNNDPRGTLVLSAALMLGVSLLSGVLFTFLGKRLHQVLDSGVRSAGLVTLANTAGATLGPLAAGFVLLPRLGIERSIFLLAVAYGAVAICGLASGPLSRWPCTRRRRTRCSSATAWGRPPRRSPTPRSWNASTSSTSRATSSS